MSTAQQGNVIHCDEFYTASDSQDFGEVAALSEANEAPVQLGGLATFICSFERLRSRIGVQAFSVNYGSTTQNKHLSNLTL